MAESRDRYDTKQELSNGIYQMLSRDETNVRLKGVPLGLPVGPGRRWPPDDTLCHGRARASVMQGECHGPHRSGFMQTLLVECTLKSCYNEIDIAIGEKGLGMFGKDDIRDTHAELTSCGIDRALRMGPGKDGVGIPGGQRGTLLV